LIGEQKKARRKGKIMKKSIIDEIAIKMLVEGEQWDQELSAIIQ